jgi:hypothetical protein
LLDDIDGALESVLADGGEAPRNAVTALVGLRRTLFPGAPAALSPRSIALTGAST